MGVGWELFCFVGFPEIIGDGAECQDQENSQKAAAQPFGFTQRDLCRAVGQISHQQDDRGFDGGHQGIGEAVLPVGVLRGDLERVIIVLRFAADDGKQDKEGEGDAGEQEKNGFGAVIVRFAADIEVGWDPVGQLRVDPGGVDQQPCHCGK